MPKQQRWAMKQKVDGIINTVERSRDGLVELANIYKEHHPDYAEMFFQLADYLDKFGAPTKQLRDII